MAAKMVKRKPAILFEVLSNAERAQNPGIAPETPAAGSVALSAPVDTLGAPLAASMTNRQESSATRIRVRGGRLQLEITAPGLAAMLFAMGLMGLGCYLLGSAAGEQRGLKTGYRSAQNSDFEGVQGSAVSDTKEAGFGQNLPVDGRSNPSETSKNSPGNSAKGKTESSATWLTGLQYIIIQEFAPAAEADAYAARRFLAEQGVSASVVSSKKGNFMLVLDRGFDNSSPLEKSKSQEIMGQIRELGRLYYRQGGRYQLSCYLMALKPEGF